MCNFTPAREAAKPAPKKQVRFEEDKLEELYELDIFDNEQKAKWMSRADFRAIQFDICRTVRETFVGQSYNSLDEDETCFRGLEPIAQSYRKVEIQAFIQQVDRRRRGRGPLSGPSARP